MDKARYLVEAHVVEGSANAAGSGAKRNASKSKTSRRRTGSSGSAANATPQQVAEEFGL